MNTSHIDIISQGAYARKQLFCKDWIVLWSHTNRFQLARTLVQPFAGHKLLDYGCGDGTFLALVYDLFPESVGVDIDPKQMADCVKRFAKSPGWSSAWPVRSTQPAMSINSIL